MSAHLLRILLCSISLGFAAVSARAATRTIVFFGDSLTAGYGLDDPASDAFPAQIEKKIEAAKLDWRVVNAGLSGETTAAGLRRGGCVFRWRGGFFVLPPPWPD